MSKIAGIGMVTETVTEKISVTLFCRVRAFAHRTKTHQSDQYCGTVTETVTDTNTNGHSQKRLNINGYSYSVTISDRFLNKICLKINSSKEIVKYVCIYRDIYERIGHCHEIGHGRQKW